MKKFLTILFVFGLVFILADSAEAQGRGKITGKIIDKSTGEVIIGANVIIEGTTMGAATDVNGNYYIIGVPAGVYRMKASYIGYHEKIIEDVRVETDLTTEINIELESTAVETPEVVVSAERKMVQRDITSTRRTFTSENIKELPGFENSLDIFKLQGGTVMGQAPQSLQLSEGTKLEVRDESVTDVHIRGGRGGEILFMIDGVPVTHPLYGGRSVLDLNVVAVEQVELLTGAFSAEYGQAQSGVVNITTRTGGTDFSGGFEYKTDDWDELGDVQNQHYGTMYLSGPEPITNNLLPLLGVDYTGKMKFFLSMSGNLTNTAYNNHRERTDYNLFGIMVDGKQTNSKNMTSKLNWDISDNFRTTVSFNGAWREWTEFDWSYYYVPNNMATAYRDNYNANLLINHVLSQNSFYSFNLGYLGIKYRKNFNGMTPEDFWVVSGDSAYSTVNAPQADPLTGFFDENSYQAIWRDDNTKTFTAKFDFTSLVHPEHLLKVGFDFQAHSISYIDIQDGAYKLSPYGEFKYAGGDKAPKPPGPYPEFGQNRYVFKVWPAVGGFYVQEKFEKEFMVINAGLRADWYYLGEEVNKDYWKSQWENATGMEADWSLINYQLSPRFGISFPILEQTVIFFSYGHFAQMPELHYYYRDPYTGGFTGNPKLNYEQTILYEFGLTHQIFDDLAIDIKSYAKDISQQIGTTRLLSAGGLPVDLYDNIGYARARGLEFELNKAYSGHTNGKLTYTVQWADGYSSSAFEDYIRSTNDFPKPIRERRLGWDIRHQVILQATLSSPPGQPLSVFGFELPDDWNLTFLSNFSSGRPYTPFTLDPALAQKIENTASGPVTTSVDIKFTKSFDIAGTRISLSIDAFNVLDQNNVNIYYGFNRHTGEPYVYGDVVEESVNKNQYYDWYTMVNLRDVRAYSPGRYVKLGIRVDF